MTDTVAAEEPAEMERRWPGWRIWRSSGGSWCATRRRGLSMEEIARGLARTLMEDTQRRLGEQLAEQRRIEGGC